MKPVEFELERVSSVEEGPRTKLTLSTVMSFW